MSYSPMLQIGCRYRLYANNDDNPYTCVLISKPQDGWIEVKNDSGVFFINLAHMGMIKKLEEKPK